MADDLSKRLRKAAEEARREERMLPQPPRTLTAGGTEKDHSVSRKELFGAFAAMQDVMAEMAERIEALERGR